MTTETLTPTDFLLARIAEDEGAARATTAPKWHVRDRDDNYFFVAAESTAIASAVYSGDRAHIARFDPARVLAECEAKRRIVGLHGDDHECPDEGTVAGWAPAGWWYGASASDVCPTLRALALPYADHPEFQEEWRA